MSTAAPLVNQQTLSAGTGGAERQSPSGEMLVGTVHGKYYEQARVGRLFHCDFGVAATGIVINAMGTSAGVALFNPAGSGVNLSLISLRMSIVSGTIALGSIVHALNTNVTAAATTGTAGTVVAGLAGGGAAAQGKPFYTATLPANPTQARIAFYKNATATTSQTIAPIEDLVDGAIALAPGATWSLVAIGTDTSPLWKISLTWEEIPQ